jgi:hypothetical protein
VPSASAPIQVPPPGLRSHRKCGRTHPRQNPLYSGPEIWLR